MNKKIILGSMIATTSVSSVATVGVILVKNSKNKNMELISDSIMMKYTNKLFDDFKLDKNKTTVNTVNPMPKKESKTDVIPNKTYDVKITTWTPNENGTIEYVVTFSNESNNETTFPGMLKGFVTPEQALVNKFHDVTFDIDAITNSKSKIKTLIITKLSSEEAKNSTFTIDKSSLSDGTTTDVLITVTLNGKTATKTIKVTNPKSNATKQNDAQALADKFNDVTFDIDAIADTMPKIKTLIINKLLDVDAKNSTFTIDKSSLSDGTTTDVLITVTLNGKSADKTIKVTIPKSNDKIKGETIADFKNEIGKNTIDKFKNFSQNNDFKIYDGKGEMEYNKFLSNQIHFNSIKNVRLFSYLVKGGTTSAGTYFKWKNHKILILPNSNSDAVKIDLDHINYGKPYEVKASYKLKLKFDWTQDSDAFYWNIEDYFVDKYKTIQKASINSIKEKDGIKSFDNKAPTFSEVDKEKLMSGENWQVTTPQIDNNKKTIKYTINWIPKWIDDPNLSFDKKEKDALKIIFKKTVDITHDFFFNEIDEDIIKKINTITPNVNTWASDVPNFKYSSKFGNIKIINNSEHINQRVKPNSWKFDNNKGLLEYTLIISKDGTTSREIIIKYNGFKTPDNILDITSKPKIIIDSTINGTIWANKKVVLDQLKTMLFIPKNIILDIKRDAKTITTTPQDITIIYNGKNIDGWQVSKSINANGDIDQIKNFLNSQKDKNIILSHSDQGTITNKKTIIINKLKEQIKLYNLNGVTLTIDDDIKNINNISKPITIKLTKGQLTQTITGYNVKINLTIDEKNKLIEDYAKERITFGKKVGENHWGTISKEAWYLIGPFTKLNDVTVVGTNKKSSETPTYKHYLLELKELKGHNPKVWSKFVNKPKIWFSWMKLKFSITLGGITKEYPVSYIVPLHTINKYFNEWR